MNTRQPGERDSNESAADAVRRATERPTPIHADEEAAWLAWSKQLQRVDSRTLTLLRAAFDAGIAARFLSPAAELGRLGASKGGEARAKALPKARRAEIAKKAAMARWKKRAE